MSRIEAGDYEQIVFVTGGPHKGRIGFYDDDEVNDAGTLEAIIYFGVPLRSECDQVPFHFLRPATKGEEQCYRAATGWDR